MRSCWRIWDSDSSENLISFQQSEPKRYTTLESMVTRHLGQKGQEKHLSARDRLSEKHNLLFLQSKEKKRWDKQEIAINGSPEVNVPEDKLVVSSTIRLRTEKEAAKDMEVYHPRDANRETLMISNAKSSVADGEQTGVFFMRTCRTACVLPFWRAQFASENGCVSPTCLLLALIECACSHLRR